MFSKILVVGVSTTDIVVRGERVPAKGEVLYGEDYLVSGGGKGANQAVGAARLGAEVALVARIGADDFGQARLAELIKEGVGVEHVVRDQERRSGVNLVIMDREGNHHALAAPGAAGALSAEDVRQAEPAFRDASVLLVQRGLPEETLDAVFELARKHGLFTIYNPSPAEQLSHFKHVGAAHVVFCNKRELGILTGKPSGHLETVVPAARTLAERGAGCVVCTLGADGAVFVTKDRDVYYETFKVQIRDTNGGGDSFAAAMACALSAHAELRGSAPAAVAGYAEIFARAIPFACACSSLAVTKYGAMGSMPALAEIERFLADQGRYVEELSGQPTPQSSKDIYEYLEEKAKKIRRVILHMVTEAGSGHPGGALSAAEIMTVLFFNELSLNANRPDWPGRDRFLLSKGHSAPVLYACLVEKGILREDEIFTLRKFGSRLQGHPDMRKCPGVEMSTGSLGQGLSVANGMALGLKLDEKENRVYVVLGDGELQEGQVWEAAMTAVHFKLDNLCAVIDYNGLQIGGSIGKVKSTLEPLVGKWESFGWNVLEINGHNIPDILGAFRTARLTKGRPTMVVAHTLKGKGISFMERSVEYHGKVPSLELLKQALDELGKER